MRPHGHSPYQYISYLGEDNQFVLEWEGSVTSVHVMKAVQRLQLYETAYIQPDLARQHLDCVVVGSHDASPVRIYDRATGELRHLLEGKIHGQITVIEVCYMYLRALA
jgi:WD40 repeat protein